MPHRPATTVVLAAALTPVLLVVSFVLDTTGPVPPPPAGTTAPLHRIARLLTDTPTTALTDHPGVRRAQPLDAGTALITLEPGTDPTGLPDVARTWPVHSTPGATTGSAPDPAVPAATSSWRHTRGTGAVVAVVTTDVDITDPALAANLWDDPHETCAPDHGRPSTAGAGADHDGDALPGDCHGWDWVHDAPTGRGAGAAGPRAEGTRVAALTAATAPGARIMPLVVGTGGTVNAAMACLAVRYAVAHGADVVLLGLPGTVRPPAREADPLEASLREAAAQGVVVVMPAGDAGLDLDVAQLWPTRLRTSTSLVVGAADPDGSPTAGTNRGQGTVDLLAPGSHVPLPAGSGPAAVTGSTVAAALTAGATALVGAAMEDHDGVQVRRALLDTADRTRLLGGPATPWSGAWSGGPAAASAAGHLDVDAAVEQVRTGADLTVTGLDRLTPGTAGDVVVDVLGTATTPATTLRLTLQVATADGPRALVHAPVWATGVDPDDAPRTTATDGTVQVPLQDAGTRAPIRLQLPAGTYLLDAQVQAPRRTAGLRRAGTFTVPRSPTTAATGTTATGTPTTPTGAATDRTPATTAPAPRATARAGGASVYLPAVGPWQVSRLSPAAGPGAGGTVVVIEGSALPPGAVVQFAGRPGTVVAQDATSITVRAPAAALTGPVDVQVWSPSHRRQVLAGAYTYLAPGGTAPVRVHATALAGARPVPAAAPGWLWATPRCGRVCALTAW